MSMPMPFNKKKELSTSEKIVQSFEQGKEEPAIAEELDIPVGFVIEHLRKKVSGYVDYHTRKRQQEGGAVPAPAAVSSSPRPKPAPAPAPVSNPSVNVTPAPKTKLVEDGHKVKLVDDEVISRSKPNEKFVPVADPNESMDDVLDRPEIEEPVLSGKNEKAEMPEISMPEEFPEPPKKPNVTTVPQSAPAQKVQQTKQPAPAPTPVSKPQPAAKKTAPAASNNNNSEVKTNMSSHGFAEKMAKIAPIEIKKLDEQIKQIKDSTSSKTNEANGLNQQIESLRADIVEAEKEIEKLKAEMVEAEKKAALLNAELQTTNTAIADLNAERAEWAKFLK